MPVVQFCSSLITWALVRRVLSYASPYRVLIILGLILILIQSGIGLLTPPVGPTMVVGCAIGKVSMEAVSCSILIFYVPMVIVLLLVTYIPALTLWLPHAVYGN